MKSLCSIALLLLITQAYSQNSVGIGTESPNNNAVLELVSPNSNQGFLVPRLTTADRTNAGFTSLLSSDDNGLLVFDSDESEFYYWNTNQWSRLRVTAATSTDFGGQILSNAADPVADSDVATKGYVDNIDINDADSDPTNEIQDLQLQGNSLSVTNNPNASTIDLAAFQGANTDEQTLALTGTDLSISNGNSVDLSAVQDGFEANTDNQVLSLAGTNLSINRGNSVNLAPIQDGFEANTDNQNLSLSGTDLSISGGNTINVSSLQDGTGTDNQTLSRSATAISISGGNSIPEYWQFVPQSGSTIEGNFRPNRIDADFQIEGPVLATEGNNQVVISAGRINMDRVRIRTTSNGGDAIYYGASGSQNVVIKGNSANRDHGEVAIYDAGNGLQARIYVNSSGNGVVTADSKSFHMQHPENPDMQIWYASLEGPEAAAYVRGQIRLENGEATIKYEDHFQQVANMEGLTINLTPHSADSKGLAAIERTSTGFKIKELFEGTGSYIVDWEAKSMRKGFEDFKVLRHKDDPDYLK